MTGSRRMVGAGAGLALLYVVTALATGWFSSRPVLPLFDGFAPPTPYGWVKPPPERAGDNVVPKPIERVLAVGADGVAASNVSTDDAQAIVGLDKGSVAAHPPDSAVTVRVIPVDAGTLGPLPPGLRAVSNAYKVELAYVPSQTPVTELPTSGTVALTGSEAGDQLLYSADGQAWQQTDIRPYGQDFGLFTEFRSVGWFVMASAAAPSVAHGGGTNALRTALLIVAGIVPIAGAILVVRLPSPVPVAPNLRPGRSTSRPRPAPKKRPKRRR